MRSDKMASEKALYWMAVSLLAVVGGNHFVSKFDGNCLAGRSRAAVERVSAKAERLMARADVMLGRTSTRFDRAQAAMAVTQARLESMQDSLTGQQVACVRMQAVRARMMVRQQMQQSEIPAAQTRVEMVVPQPQASPSADPI
jgi:hypothetical protein